MPCLRVRSTMSSSMQPPDTEPTTWPSSRTASIAPSGRGELPQVLTTVTSNTRRPWSSQSALRFNTSKSTLSIVKIPCGSAEVATLEVQDHQDDDDRRDRNGARPHASPIGGTHGRGCCGDLDNRARRRRGNRYARSVRPRRHPRRIRRDGCRELRGEVREEIVGELPRCTVDQPRADLRELAAH